MCVSINERFYGQAPTSTATWEISEVSTLLHYLGPNAKLNVKTLTLKLSMLFALVAPEMVSTQARL